MKKNINFNGNSIHIDNIKENYYIIKKLKNGYSYKEPPRKPRGLRQG